MKQEADPFKTRNISLTEKRQLMWNIIQPGDPYDIRKSMIAQLPGQQKFMGPHLEIVCLLQAAQIQRLCSFLDEYALKLREQERVNLDRHSYQIQIKQLTEKIAIDERFKMENEKLKDFIRMQSKQLEDLQRQRFNIQITKKYEDSLRQIQLIMKENDELKASLQRIISDNTNRTEQFRSIELNYQQEIQKLNDRINNQKSIRDSFDREKTLSLQQIQSKQKRYQQQLLTLRQKITSLTTAIQKSEASNRLLKEDVSKLAVQQKKSQQYFHTIQQYQHRFQLLASQIDRVNGILREKSKELQEQYIRAKQLSDENRMFEEQGNQQQLKIKNLLTTIAGLQRQNKQIWLQKSNYEERQQVIHKYEQRIQKLSFQVDRLNSVLRKKINQLDESRKKNREYEVSLGNFEVIQKQVNDLRIKLVDVNKKLFEFEKLHTTQAQEIQRLNFTLKRMIDQINYSQVKLKNSEKELENQLKRNSILQKELQEQIRINEQNKRVKQAFEQNLNQIKYETEQTKTKYKNYESLAEQNQYLRGELNKHISNVQELRSLSESLNNKVNQYKNQIDNATKVKKQAELYIESLQANITTNQINFNNLREQNIRLVKRLQQKSRVPSPQKKGIPEQSQPLPIGGTNNNFLELRQEVLQRQQRIHQLQTEVSIRQQHIKQLTENINWLEKQCRQLQQKNGAANKDCQFLFNQNNNFKNKLAILQENYRRALLELQEKTKQTPISASGKKETRTPQRITGGESVYQGDQKNTTAGMQSSSTYIKEIRRENQMLQAEYTAIKQQRVNFIQSLKELRVQNNALVEEKKKLKAIVDEQGQYYKKVIIFSEEIQRLNGVLQQKQKENKSTVYKLVEYEQTIKRLQENIGKISTQLRPIKEGPRGVDLPSNIQYENQISRLKMQLEISRTKLNEQEQQLALYQNKIAVLGQEIERLNGILKAKVNQNIQLQKAYSNVFSQKQDIIARFKELLNQNQALNAYEQKLNLMNIEIVRLNNILHQKIQLYDHLDQQFMKYKQDQALRTNSWNLKIRQYETSIINLKKEIQQRGSKVEQQGLSSPSNEQYKQKIVALSHQVERLNNIILTKTFQMERFSQKDQNYLQEIQRLNNSLRMKVQECGMRGIAQKTYLQDIESLRNEVIKQRKQKETIIQNRQMFSQQIVKAKQQMFIYQTKIKDLYEQFQRLQVVMRALKKQNQDYKNNQNDLSDLIQKNRNLGAEIDRLTKLLDDRTQEVSQIRLSLSDESSLQRRISEDLSVMVVLFAEIESLRKRVEESEKQTQQIRRTSVNAFRV